MHIYEERSGALHLWKARAAHVARAAHAAARRAHASARGAHAAARATHARSALS